MAGKIESLKYIINEKMNTVSAAAPGKIILFGEHAVVYQRPAIAVPVTQVMVEVMITSLIDSRINTVFIQSPNIGLESEIKDLSEQHPIKFAILSVCRLLKVTDIPPCTIHIHSTIPVASGLGSGAAITVALLRAFSAFLGNPLTNDQVNNLTFEVEKIHHLTPSGIDNSVITYGKPVFFVKGKPLETFEVARPFSIIIGDTRISSPTAITVGEVRQAWEAAPQTYENIFDNIKDIVLQARQAIETGNIILLGKLMNLNHACLCKINVSSPELERIISASLASGALGAKLSGSGRGGNMIALVHENEAEAIAHAMLNAGAMRTILTHIG